MWQFTSSHPITGTSIQFTSSLLLLDLVVRIIIHAKFGKSRLNYSERFVINPTERFILVRPLWPFIPIQGVDFRFRCIFYRLYEWVSEHYLSLGVVFYLNIRTYDLLTIIVLNFEIFWILLHLGVSDNVCMSGKQCLPWSDAAERGVWSGSTLFDQVYKSKYWGIREPLAWRYIFIGSSAITVFVCYLKGVWSKAK